MIFKTIPFRDLISKIVDNRGKTCPTSETGIPLIATNCVRNDSLYPLYEKVRYIDDETYKNWFRGHPSPGDMLFVTKGTPGRLCWVPDPVNFCIAQDMLSIRADEKIVYPKFLFALLRSVATQKMIENMHVGTLIPHFKKGDFNQLLLSIPCDKKMQEIIGDIYFSLSEKIELNCQTNATLEAIVQTIFKEWFVEFRFPGATGEMQDSEQGPIPRGWWVGKLGDVCENIRKTVHPKDISIDTPYVGLEHIPRKSLGLTSWGVAGDVNSQKTYFNRYDVLFGKLRPYFHKVCIAPLNGISSTDILVIRPKKNAFSFCINHLYSNELITFVSSVADGTRMPRVDWKSINNYKIILAPEAVLEQFNIIALPYFKKIIDNNQQSSTLAQTRDTLLPKLMSGEIDA